MKLLIVEDVELNIAILKKFLDKVDATLDLSIATTAAQATDSLKQQKFDAIFLDLGLPDSMGIETVKRIRQASHEVPIIVLTSTDDQETILEAIRNNVQEYLVKGEVTAAMLTRTIHSAIERKKIETQRESEIRNFKMRNEFIMDRNLGLL
ncbi:MAG: response regulator [Candidatus Omnitrophica bacterium]|nr:response regulator [Candidatus Omnitrophota bacterium]